MTVEQYLTYGNMVDEDRLNAYKAKQEREEAAANGYRAVSSSSSSFFNIVPFYIV